MSSLHSSQAHQPSQDSATSPSSSSETLHVHDDLSERHVKKATRTRKSFALLSSCFLVVAVTFLILVEVGSTSNVSVLRDMWFIKLDLSEVVPDSVPNSDVLNTIAQTLGLHDFYQVGLWNYCEGYLSSGISDCSETRALYWFNPVAIISNELLDGASIRIPSNISHILTIVKIASHWTFGLFMTGTCLTFVMILAAPLAVYSRWNALLISVITFLNAVFIATASTIATIMFTVMRDIFRRNTEVNIGAKVGNLMFACMWTASAFAILSFLVQVCLTCCCASRRDVKTGRKVFHEKALAGVT